MPTPFRLRCSEVAYRRGYIEVEPNVHPGCVNIEMWEIATDAVPAEWVSDASVSDGDVTANIELELTPDQASSLGEALLAAAAIVDGRP